MTLESRTELHNSSLCIHSIRLCVLCKNGHICAQLPIDVHKSAALLLFFASPLGGPKCTKIVKLSNISAAATRQHQQHHHASQFRKLFRSFPVEFPSAPPENHGRHGGRGTALPHLPGRRGERAYFRVLRGVHAEEAAGAHDAGRGRSSGEY